jgi:hypothetical protein
MTLTDTDAAHDVAKPPMIVNPRLIDRFELTLDLHSCLP